MEVFISDYNVFIDILKGSTWFEFSTIINDIKYTGHRNFYFNESTLESMKQHIAFSKAVLEVGDEIRIKFGKTYMMQASYVTLKQINDEIDDSGEDALSEDALVRSLHKKISDLSVQVALVERMLKQPVLYYAIWKSSKLRSNYSDPEGKLLKYIKTNWKTFVCEYVEATESKVEEISNWLELMEFLQPHKKWDIDGTCKDHGNCSAFRELATILATCGMLFKMEQCCRYVEAGSVYKPCKETIFVFSETNYRGYVKNKLKVTDLGKVVCVFYKLGYTPEFYAIYEYS